MQSGVMNAGVIARNWVWNSSKMCMPIRNGRMKSPAVWRTPPKEVRVACAASVSASEGLLHMPTPTAFPVSPPPSPHPDGKASDRLTRPAARPVPLMMTYSGGAAIGARAVSRKDAERSSANRTSTTSSTAAANSALSNPQIITCIIFENLFGPYFLPHQSHSHGYAPSSGENLTSKI